jgi:hypothetical protein
MSFRNREHQKALDLSDFEDSNVAQEIFIYLNQPLLLTLECKNPDMSSGVSSTKIFLIDPDGVETEHTATVTGTGSTQMQVQFENNILNKYGDWRVLSEMVRTTSSRNHPGRTSIIRVYRRGQR